MVRYVFTPHYIEPQQGPAPALAAMAELRMAMDNAGRTASSSVMTSPYMPGPGASEWVLPVNGSRSGAILFLHGSGFSKGSPASHRPLVARIVDAAGIRALVPDYRLAPENRYPAALEDSLETYRELLMLYPPEKIAAIGDSAGGGLAIATMLAAKDAGLALPAAVVTLSAWTDLAVTGRPRDDVDDPRVKPEMLRAAAQTYLDGADPKHPYASPLYGDLTGFPPLLMQVGGREIMIEDTLRLSEVARRAGVLVEHVIYPGMAHVFQLNQPDEAQSSEAIASVGRFLERHLALA